jgi:hypothetical protein
MVWEGSTATAFLTRPKTNITGNESIQGIPIGWRIFEQSDHEENDCSR